MVENYPNLKANEQFNRLMDELAGTENRLAVARGRYNERIQEYNTARDEVPEQRDRQGVRLQGISRTTRRPPSSQAAPKVDFKK